MEIVQLMFEDMMIESLLPVTFPKVILETFDFNCVCGDGCVSDDFLQEKNSSRNKTNKMDGFMKQF